jgi:ArsR family transcriptional regulator
VTIDEILEVLGNESRRRILSLLSKKPCYVSEISYSLKMAPKAVLEHLDKLEKAGLIKSYEEGRRRYYYINRSIRIEISITPHHFNVTLTSGNGNTDIECIMEDAKRIFEKIKQKTNSMPEIYRAMQEMDEFQRRFSRIQSLITSRLTEMFERLIDEIERSIDDEIERIVALGLTKGAKTPLEIAEQFWLSYREASDALRRLKEKGLVEEVKADDGVVWKIKC